MSHDIILENDLLRVAVSGQKGTFSCEHRGPGIRWEPDPWQGTLGYAVFVNRRGLSERVSLSSARQVSVAMSGTELTMQLSDFRTRLDGIRSDRTLGSNLRVQVSFRLAADAARLTFAIEELALDSSYWRLEQVVAPLRALYVRTTRDDGYVLAPANQGALIPSRYERGYFRYLNWVWEEIAGYTRELPTPSMPWYGAAKDDSGYIALLETPFDAGLEVIANNVTPGSLPSEARSGGVTAGGSAHAPRLSAISPIWRSSRGELGYPRRLTYTFVEEATPVKLSKIFRAYAQDHGWFRSLRDKIAENPNVAKLLGGPNCKFFMATNRPEMPEQQGFHGPVYDGYHEVSTSFGELGEIIDELGELGIHQGMVHVAGWTTHGYDNCRPIDTLPINAKAGGAEGLQQVVERAKRAGMVLAVHDNYRNLDLNAPSYDASLIGVEADGVLQAGFSSESGPSHQICSSNHLRLLKRTSSYLIGEMGVDGYFLDTTTANPLWECYHPEHPLTRQQDAENKRGLLAYLRSQGVVTGAEAGQYWAAAEVDFFEGMMASRFGIPLPLFGLVYHDAMVTYWQHGRPYNYTARGDFAEKVLLGLLYGCSHNWVFSSYVFPGWKRQLEQVQALTSAFHRQVGLEEMVDFHFHSADYMVRSSAFGDGTRVAVNLAPMAFRIELDGESVLLPHRGFWIRYPDGRTVAGQVDYVIEASTTQT